MINYPVWKKFNVPIIDKFAFNAHYKYPINFYGPAQERTEPRNWQLGILSPYWTPLFYPFIFVWF